MKKPPLQDVIVMRNVQRVGPHETRRQTLHEVEPRHAVMPARRPSSVAHEHRPQEDPFLSASEERRSPWLPIALVSGFVLVGGAFVLSLIFSGATITVFPKHDTVVADTVFTASTDGSQADMPANIITLERTAVREVMAQSETQVEERASGVITIYNEYSKSSQRLIKNTRFEADDGKIYKIHEKIEVPGQHDDGTPGSIDATVYAEVPGESYNRGPGSFTIPGFEKMPQEGKIYARSTSDISGGFVGTRKVVLEKDRLDGYEALETQLRDELRSAISQEGALPEGMWADPDAVFFEFNPLPDEVASGDSVKLSLSGKIHVVAFEESSLDRFIASRSLPGFVDAPLEITNRSDVSIVVEPLVQGTSTSATKPWQAGTYTVTLAGKADLLWQVDADSLKNRLLGIEKEQIENGMSQELRNEYPGVDSIHVVSRPFWKNDLPTNADEIDLTVTLDEE